MKNQRPSFLEAGKRKFLSEGKRGLMRNADLPTTPADVAPAPLASRHEDFDLGRWRVRPAIATLERDGKTVKLSTTTLGMLLVLREGFADQHGPVVEVSHCAVRIFGKMKQTNGVRLAVGELRRLLDGEDARIDSPLAGHYQLVVGHGPGSIELDDDVPGANAVRNFLTARRKRRLIFGAAAGAITLLIGSSLVGRINDGIVVRGIPSKPMPLTQWPGREESPSLAPDGRRLVFSWTPPGGMSDLFVLAFGQPQPQRLLPPAGPGVERRFPVWSPTAKLIAYYQLEGQDCQLRAVSPVGDGDRALTVCNSADVGPLAWSPDGASVVFAERTAADMPVRIVSFDLDDKFGQGRRQALTTPAVGQPGDTLPAFSADQQSLYFIRERALGNMDIAGIDFGRAKIRRLTRDATTWTGLLVEPGGRNLLGSSDRGGASALWRVPITAATPELVLEDSAHLRQPTLSQDGTRLVFERARELTRVLALPLAFGGGAEFNREAAAPVAWLEPNAHVSGVQFSPNGMQVAYVSDAGGQARVWIARADGSGARAMDSLKATRMDAPRWSPDSRSLVVAAAVEGFYQLHLLDVARDKAEKLTTDEADERVPAWSRDGRWIYYGSTRGAVVIEVASGPSVRGARWQLWRRPAPGQRSRDPEQLTTDGGFAAQESVDGNTLFFTRPDRPGLFARSTRGGGDDLLVSREPAVPDFAQWAVAKDALYIVAREDLVEGHRGAGITRLVRIGWPDRERTELLPLARLAGGGSLGLSPDGGQLLYTQTARWETDLMTSVMR
jgi:Tol biopolymer transport system component